MPRRALVAAVLLLLAMTGCAREPDETVLPVPSAGSPSGSGPSGSGPSPLPTPAGAMPEFCDDVIPYTQVVQIVAVPLDGGSTRTYATDFSAESGRTARLTCQYGVRPAPARGKAPPPQVEISLSSYVDAEAATARLQDTVGSARSSGQQIEAQAASGHQAFLLADAEDITYVAAVGDRTLVVTVARGVVPAPAERVVLLTLAETALGIPIATPTPTS